MFEQNLPKLHAHFNEIGLAPPTYLIHRLLSIFAKSLPLQASCYVWDHIMIRGEEFIPQAALGILSAL